MIRIPIIVKERLGRKPCAVAIHVEPLCQECLLRTDSKALIAGGQFMTKQRDDVSAGTRFRSIDHGNDEQGHY